VRAQFLGHFGSEFHGMGTTCTTLVLLPRGAIIGHIGDSRIYYLPEEGGIRQVTQDHSYVGWLRRKGELNERQAREHPGRNALNQALGAGNQFIDPHIGAIDHRPGDRFLICSDGVIDGLWDRQIEDLVRTSPPADSPATPAQRLVDQAVQASGRDNTTAVVIEIPADPDSPPSPRRLPATP
jgi:protein phosphatase